MNKVYEFGNKKIQEHLGGIYDFLQHKRMETLQELERSRDIKPVSGKSAEQENSGMKLSYEERKEFQRQIKRMEKAVAESEKKIEQLENEIHSIEKMLALPEGASDMSLYEKHGALKKSLNEVVENWAEQSEQLEKMRLQDI